MFIIINNIFFSFAMIIKTVWYGT